MVGPVRATALASKDAPRKSPTLPVLLEASPFPLNNGKYEAYHDFKFIAQGSFGTTSMAIDEIGRKVLVKEFNFRVAEGMSASQTWEVHDAFEREVNTIKRLDHPLVPKYIDSFSRQVDGKVTFYLVTEYVEGPNLEDRLTAGPVTEARGIAKDVFGVLKYFQSFSPPLLHRDITPKNIVLDAQGRAHLVDLGSVALKACTTIKGTICGTPGYGAPEQLLFGKASTASEVYGVGATLIRVLTRQEIADLVDDQGRINFRKYANVRPEFAALLEKMIEPKASERFANAEEALKAIEDLETGKAMIRVVDATSNSSLFRRKSPEEKELDAKAREVTCSIVSAARLIREGRLSDDFAVHVHDVDVRFVPEGKLIQVGDTKISAPRDRYLMFLGAGIIGAGLTGALIGSTLVATVYGAAISLATSALWNWRDRRDLFKAVRTILAEKSERSNALIGFHIALEHVIEEKKNEPSNLRMVLHTANQACNPYSRERRKAKRLKRDAEVKRPAMLEEDGKIQARKKLGGMQSHKILKEPRTPFYSSLPDDAGWEEAFFPELKVHDAEEFNSKPQTPTFLERIRRTLPAFKK